jgi:FG-GAP repeat
MIAEFKLTANDAETYQHFGSAVALDGDYAIIGAPGAAGDQGAAYVFQKSGPAWTVQSKLSASDAGGSDRFGQAVGIDGDYAIVGAPSAHGFDGQAYIFHRNGPNWIEESILAASDKTNQAFGRAVGLSGDWAIVGARDAAYVFQPTGSTWTERGKLTGSPLIDFGRAVSIKGDDAVVGASNGARVYAFRRSGTTWQLQDIVTASDGTAAANFGWSVSISGGYMIVGAYLAFGRGAAYIFYQHAGSWIPQIKLEPTTFGSSQFGFSVAISNDYAVVGDPLALDGGVTYLYRRNGSSWVMLDQITASDTETNDNFGDSVNIDPNSGLAIVGAPNNNDGLVAQGAAYTFSDLHKMIEHDRYILTSRIIFGLIGGGGGTIWLPGTGPVPVDPEPFKVWSTLSPIKQDLLVGLALDEIANLTNDQRSRQAIKTTAVNLMKTATREMRVSNEG